MNLRLEGKTALITGASTGIGRATALALAKEGVSVMVTARREDLLKTLVNQVQSAHKVKAEYFAIDLTQDGAPKKISSWAVQKMSRVDILINNAGGSRPFNSLHVSEESWVEAMALNFERPRQLAESLIDQMISNKWGRVVNVTGKSEPEMVNGAFCAKAALHSWAKGLSRMVGPQNVTVNCISPGHIDSEQISRLHSAEFRKEQIDRHIPMRRYGQPEDLANLVCFLASDLASYITGALIPVDGGLRKFQF
jgi:3-oxoacyl-[acyl-carrier protein] reductase